MRKINRFGLLFTIGLGIMLISCEDILDKEPIDRIDINNFYTTPEEAEIGLIGAYSRIISKHTMQNIFWFMVSADEVTAGIHAKSGIGSGDHRELTTSDMWGMMGTYTEPLVGIANINLLLSKIDDIPDASFAGARKDEIKGEAYFLRGYAYYMHAMIFRDVPIVLDVPQSSDPLDNIVPKNSQEEVLDQAMTDFEEAIRLLPTELQGLSDHEVRGRGSKWAAKAFKAKIHMWREEWDLAYQECEDILTSGQFILEPKWTDIFYSEPGGESNSNEVIWQSQGQSRQEYDFMGTYRWYSDANPESATPQFMVEKSLTDMFERPWKDVRLEYSVIRINESGATSGYGGRNVKHFHVPSGIITEGVTDESRDKNYPLLRLAEVMLMKAECIVQSNYTVGTAEEALDILNDLRARAEDPEFVPRHEPDIDDDFVPGEGTTGIAPLTMDQLDLQAVKDEKRRELMFESGVRWIDQLRWDRQNGFSNVMAQVNAANEHRLYAPIHQSQINVSNGVLVQNPGY